MVREAWRSVLGREPTEAELDSSVRHYARQSERFQNGPEGIGGERAVGGIPTEGQVLWLAADRGLEQRAATGSLVEVWRDGSGGDHHAHQEEKKRQPLLVEEAIGGHPAVRFSGKREFLRLTGDVVNSQASTILAVASDRSGLTSHRGIFSNWNGKAGNLSLIHI